MKILFCNSSSNKTLISAVQTAVFSVYPYGGIALNCCT